jgi:hypothetical protein
MGEYEPDDSRTVTQSPHRAPGEPPRTGPREDQARAEAEATQQQGIADPEPEDKPTARDAHGNKQAGYASEQVDTDEHSVPLAK